MDVCKEFGRVSRILRKMQDLSLDDLYRRGLDKSYLCEVEQGRHNVGLRYISRLAKALRVEIVDFFWGFGWSLRRIMGRIKIALDRLIFEIIEEGRRDLAEELLQALKQKEQRLEEFLLRSEVGAQKQSQDQIRKGRNDT